MNNTITGNIDKRLLLRQTVPGRNTYSYARTQVRSSYEKKPVVASAIKQPLETDGPATCLVYFFNN